MYWSAPLANACSVWGSVVIDQPGMLIQPLYYYIAIMPTTSYVMYSQRKCTVRNGNQWGSHSSWPSYPPTITNDNLYVAGVDLNLVNYKILGVSPLAPAVTLAGRVLRPGELGAPPARLVPQIGLAGRVHRAGAFEGINSLMVGGPVLANPGGLSGGPLWKPAKLCQG